jgi:hypothetical protein
LTRAGGRILAIFLANSMPHSAT